MATTPEAAKVHSNDEDNDDEVMEIDNQPGDDADIESDGKSTRASTVNPPESRKSRRKTTSHTSGTVSPESTRSRRKSNQKAKSPSPAPSVEIIDDDDEEDIADGDEETFAVEKVLDHKIIKSGNGKRTFQYLIKWLGYDKASDNTWEDEANCLGSQQLLDTYWESKGGRPDLSKPGPGRKRKIQPPAYEVVKHKKRDSSSVVEEDHTPLKNRVQKASSWKVPDDDDWDSHVARIETVEKTEKGMLLVQVEWLNGKRSTHDTTTIYQKCPQKMLQFYESHLVFRPDPANEEIVDEEENTAE